MVHAGEANGKVAVLLERLRQLFFVKMEYRMDVWMVARVSTRL